MASPTTTSILASFIPQYWDRTLGDNLRPNLYMYDLGEVRKLPPNFGTSIRVPRIRKSMTAAARDVVWATTEGATMATCALSSEFVSGTLKKFVGAYKHSDLVVMTALSDVIQLSLEDISYALAKQMDKHIQGQLSKQGLVVSTNFGRLARTAATYAKISGANGAVLAADTFKPLDFAAYEALLDRRDNPRYPGTNKFAMVVHPLNKYSIITGTSSTFIGWVDINKYNNAEKIFNGEIGSLLGFKVIASSNMTLSWGLSAAATSYTRCYALAPRAYYVTELSEMSARTYVKQLGSGGTSDPTNDICTVGAKVFFTAIRGGDAFSGSKTDKSDGRQLSIYAPIPGALNL